MSPRTWFLAASALVAGCGEPPTCDEAIPHDPPTAGGDNVLVLLLDDAGVDQFPAYGEHPDPPTTPVLDGLAAEGLRFTRAYASPTCSPTRASLLTGRHPRRTGIGHRIAVQREREDLDGREISLAELVAPAGYTSAMVGKWHLSVYDDREPELDPLRQGFSHYRGILGNPVTASTPGHGPLGYFNWERVDDGAVSWSEDYLTTSQVDDAIDLLGTLPEPWLLVVAFSAPHAPWHTPPEHLRLRDALPTDEAGQYREVLEALDIEMGRLLDAIPADVRARTHIVLTSDNGTPDQGVRAPWPKVRSKGSTFEGGIRVPLVVVGPRVGTPGGETSALVHAVDVFATVADLAGVDLTEAVGRNGEPLEVDGRSFLRYVEAPHDATRRQCVFIEHFFEEARSKSAVVGERYKLVTTYAGEEELYDLQHDGWDEGPDLLSGGASEEALAAAERLRDERRRYERALR